jgi:hypothetical protein
VGAVRGGYRARRRQGTAARRLLYVGVAWAGLGAYGLVYLLTALDLPWLVGTTVERLLLHVAPVALLAAAWSLEPVAQRVGGAPGGTVGGGQKMSESPIV